MNVVQIGPFALDGLLLVCIVGLGIVMLWTIYRDKKTGLRVEPILWYGLLLSLFAGRLGFVWRFWPAYQEQPTHIINIRDGGFDWRIALLTYLLLLVALSFRHRAIFLRLLQSSLLGAVVIGLGVFGLQLNAPAQPAWFDLPHLTSLVPFQDQESEHLQIDEYAGKPMVINLWASWCPPCRREMPVLQTAQEQNPDIHFLFINQGESSVEIQQFLDEQALQLNHLWLDPMSLSGPAIGSKGLPSTLFVDSTGAIQSTRLGELSAASLQSHLDSIRDN